MSFAARLPVLLARAPRVLGAVLIAAALSSCGAPELPPPAGALRLAFPAQAGAVLDDGGALVATADGFAPAAPRDAPRGFSVELPRAGEGDVRLRMRDGLDLRVRELGAAGQGLATARAVAYRRAGGTSFWTVGAGRVEHWLHLDHGVPRGGLAAAWEIGGGTLWLHGDAVAVMDEAGKARLWVTAPRAFGGGGRPLTTRLAVRGARLELFVAGAAEGEPLLVDPEWTTAAPMLQERSYPTATLLADGRVLVAGGQDFAAVPTSSAERYDPVTNVWTAVASMASARALHTATLLGDGKVLIAGGHDQTTILASAELFDPQTGTFSPAGAMAVTRVLHTATLLGIGKVLIAGGAASAPLPGAELYDPQSGAFSPAGPLVTSRASHTATLLAGGDVLLAGGTVPASLVTLTGAELYHPQTDTFSATGPFATARSSHAATLLAGGDVLAAGGQQQGASALSSAERYHPLTGAWTSVANLLIPRLGPTATLLPGGEVVVTGGADFASAPLASAELFDPTVGTWQERAPMAFARLGHTATPLGSAGVLVAGGNRRHVEIFSLAPGGPGATCLVPADCSTGFCVDGVCCNTPCGACHVCSVPQGAVADGICTATSGAPCDDGNPCTQLDLCNVGVCQGSSPIPCVAMDACHLAGVCVPATATCTNPPAPDGAPCTAANLCTKGAVCHAGACQGGSPTSCPGADACNQAGACDPQTGLCAAPPKPDGTPCDDGNACTHLDGCQAGICAGVSAVVCMPLDACHENGACDPATGQCTNPQRPDGAPCPGGTCMAGVCGSESDGGATSTGGGGAHGGCGCWMSGREEGGGGWLGWVVVLLVVGRRWRITAGRVWDRAWRGKPRESDGGAPRARGRAGR